MTPSVLPITAPLLNDHFKSTLSAASSVDWHSHKRAGIISDPSDLSALINIHYHGAAFVKGNPKHCALALASVLDSVVSEEAINLLFVYLSWFFPTVGAEFDGDHDSSLDPDPVAHLHNAGIEIQLAKLLGRNDLLIALQAASLLTSMAALDKRVQQQSAVVDTLSQWILSRLEVHSMPEGYMEIVLSCLSVLLECNVHIGHLAAFNNALCRVLEAEKPTFSSQNAYFALLCLWLLSMNHAQQATLPVALIVQVLKNASKEKIIRITLYWVDLYIAKENPSPNPNLPSALTFEERSELLQTLQSLARSQHSFSDTELLAMLTDCTTALKTHLEDTSLLWTEYSQELEATSSSLPSSSIHNNKLFWQKCAPMLNTEDCAPLKRLVCKLFAAVDVQGVRVALADLAMYFVEGEAVIVEQGRRVICGEQGWKERLVNYMSYPDAGVQYSALIVVQRLFLPARG